MEGKEKDMRIQMNGRLRDRLAKLNNFVQSHPLEEELRHVIDSPILEVDGCFFFEELWKGSSGVSLSHFSDQTGLECFVNHLHMEEYVESTSTTLTFNLLLAQGWQCATHLAERLVAYRPEVGFRIIIGAGEGTWPTCTVRFHLIRDDENWLSDDLEEYREEAVGFMDTKMG
jgi:hypothetical protein